MKKKLRNCYVLNLKDKAESKNGFRWIKELVLQMQNLNMYNAYHKSKKNGIEVHTVKTDAFTSDTRNVETAIEILEFQNDIGGWRVSKENDEIALPSVTYNIVENERVEIPEIECRKEFHVKDEYDTDNIIDEHISNKNPVIIAADCAGSGNNLSKDG